MIDVVKPGPLTTVQDQGRHGWAHLGIPRAGALDASALAAANALVGNDSSAAGLEMTMSGCTLHFRTAAVVAITGAAAKITINNEPQHHSTPLPVRPTDTLTIGPATSGVRIYLAVRGGIAVASVLGSRSRDTLADLGPEPLRRGDTLPIGPEPFNPPVTNSSPSSRTAPPSVPVSRLGTADAGLDTPDIDVFDADTIDVGAIDVGATDAVVRVRFGPRDDWFVPEARDVLCGSAYTMTTSSNRVGARLSGPPLLHADVAAELPSEGIVLGAVQVAPDGMPMVFLADHPTTGGYPVIAVVDAADIGRLAQVRPGGIVRFREC